MKTFVFLTLVLFTSITQGQSPCDKIKLYDEVIVKGDQPIFQILKRFDKKLIPDSALLRMKNEIIELTSPEFFCGLKIKSVKLFDSAVATAWSWTHEPIIDNSSSPVYFFYAVIFETVAANKTPFVFRLDILKNGALVNDSQLAFFINDKVDIIGCKKIMALALADTIQPIKSIDQMFLAYSITERAIIWSIASVVDPKTGIQYLKDIDAANGYIIQRSFYDVNAPVKLEEAQIPKEN